MISSASGHRPLARPARPGRGGTGRNIWMSAQIRTNEIIIYVTNDWARSTDSACVDITYIRVSAVHTRSGVRPSVGSSSVGTNRSNIRIINIRSSGLRESCFRQALFRVHALEHSSEKAIYP